MSSQLTQGELAASTPLATDVQLNRLTKASQLEVVLAHTRRASML